MGFHVGNAEFGGQRGSRVKRARDSPVVAGGAQGVGDQDTVSLEMALDAVGTGEAQEGDGTEPRVHSS